MQGVGGICGVGYVVYTVLINIHKVTKTSQGYFAVLRPRSSCSLCIYVSIL